MNKTLVLISNSYPEKGKETFLVQELPILANYFDKIIILPLKQTSNPIILPNNVSVCSILSDFVSKREKLSYLMGDWKTLFKVSNSEQKSVVFSLLLKYGVQSRRINSFLSKSKIKLNQTLFYTYWLDEGAVILALLKEKTKQLNFISRAHGYDLYGEDYPTGLPPFYNYALSKINKIFFISKNGEDYFREKHKLNIPLDVAKLGTLDYGLGPEKGSDLVIATCSSIIPLKRLELLANALIKLNLNKVIWHHHGGGPLKSNVLSIVQDCPNIETHFHGQVSNEDLMRFYKKTYISLFINVSRTEGLPVSLVEAASFGIPLLATDVRGTNEICNEETGVLIAPEVTLKELIKEIEAALMKEWDRSRIREYWKERFLAEKNFNEFAKKIVKL